MGKSSLKAVIIAANRSGGTFLSHALDSHPLIVCERDEPLHRRSPYARAGLDIRATRDLIWSREQSAVNMFKVSYSQFLGKGDVFPKIFEVKPHIIHLYRDNLLAAGLSEVLRRERGFPTHHINRIPGKSPSPVSLNPITVADMIEKYILDRAKVRNKLKQIGSPTIEISYVDITGGEGESVYGVKSNRQICIFLDVYVTPLMAQYVHKVNPSIKSNITNLDEIVVDVKGKLWTMGIDAERVKQWRDELQ